LESIAERINHVPGSGIPPADHKKNAPLKKSGAAMKRMEKLLLDSKKHL
jgi:hypothetical protein